MSRAKYVHLIDIVRELDFQRTFTINVYKYVCIYLATVPFPPVYKNADLLAMPS